jgi:hypothetical protein
MKKPYDIMRVGYLIWVRWLHTQDITQDVPRTISSSSGKLPRKRRLLGEK